MPSDTQVQVLESVQLLKKGNKRRTRDTRKSVKLTPTKVDQQAETVQRPEIFSLPEIVRQPAIVRPPIQQCKKWPISTRSHLKRTLAPKHTTIVNSEVSKKVFEVENFHSKQFDWVNKFQPVNMISLKTVKRLGKKHHYCELRNCHFSTYSNRAMANHLTKAHPRYACQECEFETYDKKTYYSHRIYRHGKKKKMVLQIKAILYCPDCSFQTFYQKALDNHKIKHFVEDPDFQVDAGIVSLRRSSRRKPVSITKRNVPKKLCDFKMLRCNWCSYKTIHKKNLRNHESNVHMKDKPTLQKFNCQQCPFNTFNQAILKNHCMVFKHKFLEVKTLRCPICPYTSISDSNLIKHFLSKHKKTRKVGIKSPLSCEDCPFKTYNKGNFKKHSIVFKHSEMAICEIKFVKEFACPLCPYTSRLARRNLENHMVKHLDARPFHCSQCEFKANTKHNLARHTTRNHTNYKTLRPYPCKICQRRYRTKSTLNHHLQCHLRYPSKSYPKLDPSKLDKYSCEKCPYESKQRASVVTHQLVHSDERPFPCELCDWRFKTRRCLHSHLQRHKKDTLEKIYKCSTCDKAFAFKSDWANHEKNHELRKTKGFSCTLCDFKTSLPSCLSGHMSNKHSDLKPYKCNLCEYASKSSKCLSRHIMYIHDKLKRPKRTAPNRFKCTHPGCSYATCSNVSLDIHIRKHTGEKPFSCKFCEYKCATGGSLNTHLLRHTDERRFACTQCDYKARQPMALTNHMRTHTGERPFGCDQCGYRATQKQSLARHVYNVHTTKEEKEAIAQAKALAPRKIVKLETKKKGDSSATTEVVKTKPQRAKPWRNPVTSKSEKTENSDEKDVVKKKRKRSKKVSLSESSEGEESDISIVSEVSENEGLVSADQNSLVEKKKSKKKGAGRPKKVPKAKSETENSKVATVYDKLELKHSGGKEIKVKGPVENLSRWSLRKKAPQISYQKDVDTEEESGPEDGPVNQNYEQDGFKQPVPSRKEIEMSPVVIKTSNSNRKRNTHIRRRDRIQRFALKKQKDSIQTKQQASYIPYEAFPTLGFSEEVLLNEEEKLNHLKKMTDDMWGNIFNQ